MTRTWTKKTNSRRSNGWEKSEWTEEDKEPDYLQCMEAVVVPRDSKATLAKKAEEKEQQEYNAYLNAERSYHLYALTDMNPPRANVVIPAGTNVTITSKTCFSASKKIIGVSYGYVEISIPRETQTGSYAYSASTENSFSLDVGISAEPVGGFIYNRYTFKLKEPLSGYLFSSAFKNEFSKFREGSGRIKAGVCYGELTDRWNRNVEYSMWGKTAGIDISIGTSTPTPLRTLRNNAPPLIDSMWKAKNDTFIMNHGGSRVIELQNK